MAKAKPCRVCGGPKTPGIRGGQYCDVCRENSVREVAKRAALAKSEKRLAATNARLKAEGKPQRVHRSRWPEGQKWCGRCERFLPLEAFKKTPRGRIAAYCPPCTKRYNHERHVQVQFGLSPGQYQEMLEHQGGRCAICGNMPHRYNLAVDHDHETGKVRGLLCGRCNKDLLGAARDNIDILRRAVAYMENPPALGCDVDVMVPGDKSLDERVGVLLTRSQRAQRNSGATFGASFIECSNRWVAVLTLDQFCTLLREATA